MFSTARVDSKHKNQHFSAQNREANIWIKITKEPQNKVKNEIWGLLMNRYKEKWPEEKKYDKTKIDVPGGNKVKMQSLDTKTS